MYHDESEYTSEFGTGAKTAGRIARDRVRAGRAMRVARTATDAPHPLPHQGYEDLASLLGYDGPCVEPRLPLKPDVEPRFPGEVPGPLFL